jgi:hypothetical protein
LCNYGLFLLDNQQSQAIELLKEALSLDEAVKENMHRVKDIVVVFTKLGLMKEIESFLSSDLLKLQP